MAKFDNVAVIYYRGSAEKDDSIRRYVETLHKRNNELKPSKRHYDFMFADCYMDNAFNANMAIIETEELVSRIIYSVKCNADDDCIHHFMLVLVVKCVDEYFDWVSDHEHEHGFESPAYTFNNDCGVAWSYNVETNDSDTLEIHEYCKDDHVEDEMIYVMLHDLIINHDEILNMSEDAEDSTITNQLWFLTPEIFDYYGG